MERACNMQEEDGKKRTACYSENLKEKDHSRDLDVDRIFEE